MFYLMADFHIGQSLRSSPEFELDSYIAVQHLTESILDDKATQKTVILAGDNFGTKRIDGKGLRCFKSFVNKLMANGIEILFIQGNHDFNDIPIPSLEACKHIHKTLHTVNGVRIYGLDYMITMQLKEELKTVPPCDLLVLHTGFQHLLGFEGAFSLKASDIPPQVKNVLVGHIHKTDLCPMTTGGFIISPGGLHPCAIDQGNVHGYWKSPDCGAQFDFVQIPTRQIEHCFLFEAENEKEAHILLTKLSERPRHIVQKPVVVLNYTVKMSSVVAQLQKTYSDSVVFITDIKSSKMDVSLDIGKATISEQTKLENALDLIMSPTQEADVYRFLQELIGAENPTNFLDDKLKECLTIKEDGLQQLL